jgi:His/Glu/Gln/Arg/opine family amino acid ABC transporter permease subunit
MTRSSFRRFWRSGAGERTVGYAALVGLVVLIWQSINWEFASQLQPMIIYEYRLALLRGLGITLIATGVTLVAGFVAGVAMGIAYQLPFAPLRWIITAHVEIWRNTPLLVQLFWVHFALPVLTGVPTNLLVSGILAMTLQASAYLTEIARAGIAAVEKGQWEAAYALGIPAHTRWISIILPQAMKIMIPPLANTGIMIFRMSTILSVLYVGELLTAAYTIAAFIFKPIEVLTAVGVIYYILGTLFSKLTYKLELVLKRSDR